MVNYNVSSAVASNLTDAETKFSVDTVNTDGATDQKETEYINDDWAEQLGYFTTIPEINAVINAKATWTVGKGFKASPTTTMILDGFIGWGKDTFNTILENMSRTYHIGTDAFAEIIRDKKTKLPINLKPLDPSSIKIIVNRKGIIIRYEQISKVKNPTKTFKPEQILHFARNRVADEIHGSSMIMVLKNIIDMKNEVLENWRRVLRRNIDPLWIFHLDTDDPTEVANIKAKNDAARGAHENMYVPKGVVVPELVATGANATLNPLPTLQMLDDNFYQQSGVPKIIVGGSGEFTEATAKISYLVFQQTIEEEQLYIEEQIANQLGLLIELDFPVSLENELLSDNKKDGAVNVQPNETTAGSGQ